jgi:hypothetical protein
MYKSMALVTRQPQQILPGFFMGIEKYSHLVLQ